MFARTAYVSLAKTRDGAKLTAALVVHFHDEVISGGQGNSCNLIPLAGSIPCKRVTRAVANRTTGIQVIST
jgi:hypothetical protein